MNWKDKVKKNLIEAAELTKDAIKMTAEGLKNDYSKKQIPEEKLDDIVSRLENDPNFSKEDAMNALKDVFNEEEKEDENKLEELWKHAVAKVEALRFFLDKEVIEKIREKIDKAKENKDVKQLKKVLNMESSINDIMKSVNNLGSAISKEIKDKFFK